VPTDVPAPTTLPTVPVSPAVSRVLEPLIETFGPFLIPVALFVLGAVGYLLLLALDRKRGDGG